MKSVFAVLVVIFLAIASCDTPEPATTDPNDTTTIDRDRMDMDTTLRNDTDTMRQDTL